MFKSITAPIAALSEAIIEGCEMVRDIIKLAHNEVDNLDAEQQIRMDELVKERAQAALEREKAEKSVKRSAKRKQKAQPTS